MKAIIVAMDKNRLIGSDNKLPWRLPADMQYFKKITQGHTVLMGRKTYESIGKPLPNRENVILTRNSDYQQPGCTVIHNIDDVNRLAALNDIFIIGGAEVYRQLMDHCERLYITYIDDEFKGDAYFPSIDTRKWALISNEKGVKDDKNPYHYYFRVYERK